MTDTQREAEGKWDKAKGIVKEEVGKATDDRSLEMEGRVDQVKGDLKQAVAKVERKLE